MSRPTDAPAQAATTISPESVCRWLQKTMGRLLQVDPANIDTRIRFREIGLESVQITALVAELSEYLGRSLVPTLPWQYPTPIALARRIATLTERGQSPSVQQPEQPAGETSVYKQRGLSALNEPIAIVGMGCRLPDINSPEEFWAMLTEGRQTIRQVPAERWNIDEFLTDNISEPGKMTTSWGGFIDGHDRFDAAFFGISPREAQQMDPQQRLMLELAWESIEDSGRDPLSLKGQDVGVFVGAMWSDYARLTYGDAQMIETHTATGQDTSIISARVSYALGLAGTSLTVNTACSSSLVAIHLACNSLRMGETSMALAAGVHLILSPHSTIAMSKLGAMNPLGQCRAFDAEANGYVRGEGAGMVVLKPLGRAVADGDRIYAVIRGSAINSDGYSNGLTAPNPDAQEDVLRRSIAHADIDPGSIHYVETHGPGTTLGDPIEAGALGAVIGVDHSPERPLRIGSVKTNVGHLEAAAGIMGLMKVALAMHHRTLPPNLHYSRPNPHIPFDDLHIQVQAKLENWPFPDELPRAGVNSFGFGGTNCHALLEAAPGSQTLLLPLAGDSDKDLRQRVLAALDVAYQVDSWNEAAALCRTASAQASGLHRVAITARTPEELIEGLSGVLANRDLAAQAPERKPRVVFVCPGHGAQWRGMARTLIAQEPVFRAEIAACDRHVRALCGWSVIDQLVDDQQARFDDADVVQLSLFSVQVALGALWRSYGVQPDALIGHSMGEIAAAYLAGALSLADAVRVMVQRSQLVREHAAGRGGMTVVALPADELQSELAGTDELVLAAFNSPNSTVLSGTLDALDRVEVAFKRRGVRHGRVKIAYASHSRQMEPLMQPLRDGLEGLAPRQARVPVYSTVTGTWLSGPECGPGYWAENLRRPVQFRQAIEAIAAEGPCVFVELSAHPVLRKPVQQTLAAMNAPVHTLASFWRNEDERTGMLQTLAALYQLGIEPRFQTVLARAPGLAAVRADIADAIRERLGEPPAHADELDTHVGPIPVVLSARTEAALRAQAERLRTHALTHPDLMAGDIAFSLVTCRSHFDHRTALIIADRATDERGPRAALLEGLESLANGVPAAGTALGKADVEGKVVFVFPGQGAQWDGMARSLLETSDVFRECIEACDRAFSSLLGWSILAVLREEPDAPSMTRIDVVQPVLFSMMVSLAAVWRSLGVEPDAVVGHSQGEIAAAYVSGALSLEDAVTVVGLRSRALTKLLGRGSMALVGLDESDLAERLTRWGERISIAAVNGPGSTLTSGDPDAIGALIEELATDEIFVRVVRTDVAGHNAQTEALRDELLAAFAGLTPREPEVAFYSTVAGGRMTGDARLDADYWFSNLREPVLFAAATESLLADGHRFFIEVSSHPLLRMVLNNAVEASVNASGASGAVVSTLRRNEGTLARIWLGLGDLHTRGLPIDWSALLPGRKRVSLPTYAFQRERYWLEAPAAPATAALGYRALTTDGHPLIGAPFQMSAPAGVVFWEQALSLESLPWLSDHRVDSTCVFPGAGYVEMAAAAVREEAGERGIKLEDVAFTQALILPESGSSREPVLVQVARSEDGPGAWQLSIAQAVPRTGAGKDGAVIAWQEVAHARARLALGADSANAPTLADARSRCTRELPVDDLYAAFARIAHNYGPAFRGVRELFLAEDGESALGRIELPDAAGAADHFTLHPSVLDGCLHVALAGTVGRVDGPMIPVRIRSLVLNRPVGSGPLYCQARISQSNGDTMTSEVSGHSLLDATLWDRDGLLIGRMTGLEFAPLASAERSRDDSSEDRLGDALLAISWRDMASDALDSPRSASGAGRWLLLADASGLATRIAAELGERGVDVTRVRADASLSAALDAALRADEPLSGLICTGAVDAATLDDLGPEPLLEAGQEGWGRVLEAVQALAGRPLRDPPRLVLVTQQSQAIAGVDTVRPEQALLWALGGTLRSEHPLMRPLRVDMGDAHDMNEIRSLVTIALADSDEDQVALRGQQRYVARLRRATPPQESRYRVQPAGQRPYQLMVERPGTLDTLRLHAFERQAPGAGQVEIAVETAGVNFKDVLSALGELPPPAGRGVLLGIECAGRIIRVGDGVTGLSEGQPVLAFAEDAFATHVTIPESWVFPLPDSLSFEQATTLPIVHLTAYYALHHVGRLRAGERVLIHSAAGGVGLAALQWAKHVGAVVMATAGTEDKRQFLREQGVTYVSDSRSDQFVSDVLEWTDGEGVDVVLNSLASPFLEKSFKLLRECGRFVEIGRRDYLADNRIGLKPFLSSLSFTFVDVAAMLARRPELARQVFAEILEHVQNGVLGPLPHRTFPLSRASDVFWEMGRGQHIGKFVLRVNDDTPVRIAVPVAEDSALVDAAGSYLITGGLGGLGLSLAGWLAERGAGHLVLVSRSGLDERRNDANEVNQAIAAMREHGTQVTVAVADVGNRDELAAVIRALPADRPLKGVVHAAGVLDDGLLVDLTPARFHRVLAPKMAGAWNLHTLTRASELDFFVLYSSVTPLLGSPGQGNYVAGNAFLDALAHHRRSLGLPALALGWGPFAEVGLAAADDKRGARLAGRGMTLLSPNDGLELFARLVPTDITHIAPCPFDARQWVEFYPEAAGWPYLQDLLSNNAQTADESTGAWLDTVRRADAKVARQMLVAHVLGELGQVVRMDPAKLDPGAPFSSFGVDSLMGMELRNRLQMSTGQALPSTTVWTYPTAVALAGLLMDRLRADAPESPAVVDDAPSADAHPQDIDLPLDAAVEDLLLEELEDLEELING